MSDIRTIAVLAIACTVSASAHAATLKVIEGEIMVNQGGGYETVNGSTEVGLGTTAVAKPGGRGEIVYPDGTTAAVEPGTLVTVVETGAVPGTGSAGAGEGSTTGEAAVEPEATGGIGAGTVIVGGVVVGAAVGLAIHLSNNDNSNDGDKPASP